MPLFPELIDRPAPAYITHVSIVMGNPQEAHLVGMW